MEAFITGHSVISSSGAFSAPAAPAAPARASAGPGGGDGDTKDIVLAERTSQLMSSYRDYVTERGGDEEALADPDRIYGAGNGDGGGGRLRDRAALRPLIRDWSAARPADRCELEMEGDDGSYDCDDCSKKHRYSLGVYRSGKLRRLLLAVIVAGAGIATVATMVKSGRERQLPDWDQELKEELREETEAGRRELPHQQMIMNLNSLSKVVGEDASVVKEDPEEWTEDTAAEGEGGAGEGGGKGEGSLVQEDEQMDSEGSGEDAPVLEEEPEAGTEGTSAEGGGAGGGGKEEQEQEEPLKEEDIREEGTAVLTGAGLEAITRHILCCSSAPSPSSRALAAGDEETPPPAGNLVAAEYARAEALRPRWYDRSDGWRGRTQPEARAFCAGRRADDGDGGEKMRLCPYEAYCPTGPRHLPMGGIRVEENEEGGKTTAYSSRAPVSDRPDGWVKVGSLNVCVQYDIVDADDGTQVKKEVETTMTDVFDNSEGNGDRAAALAAKAAAHVEYGVDSRGGLVEEIYVPVAKPGAAAMVEELIANSEKNQDSTIAPAVMMVEELIANPEKKQASTNAPHQLEPASPKQEQALQSSTQTVAASADAVAKPKQKPQLDMTALLRKQFKPLWFTSDEGWNGGSHDDAVNFCTAIRGKQICPYSAMCPQGPGHGVMGGRHELEFLVEGEQYAPVLGGKNHWIMIGGGSDSREKCKSHRQLEGSDPAWGLNGDRSEVKKHVMCCTVE